MIDRFAEYEVYLALIELLRANRWAIACACPPFGTDARFRKCLFPRRDLTGSERGPRDEVDIIAYDSQYLLLIECKPRLSESLGLENALGETDADKLKRILANASPMHLAELLRRATGLEVPDVEVAVPILAVGLLDVPAPSDMTVIRIDQATWEVAHKPPLTPGWPLQPDR